MQHKKWCPFWSKQIQIWHNGHLIANKYYNVKRCMMTSNMITWSPWWLQKRDAYLSVTVVSQSAARIGTEPGIRHLLKCWHIVRLILEKIVHMQLNSLGPSDAIWRQRSGVNESKWTAMESIMHKIWILHISTMIFQTLFRECHYIIRHYDYVTGKQHL